MRVRQVMEPDTVSVTSQTSVQELVQEWLLGRRRRALPVWEDGRLAGIVTLTDVKGLPQERWSQVRVAEIMSRHPIYSVEPEDDLETALRLLAEHDINQLLVVQGGLLVGLLSRADIIRYLQLRQELGIKQANPQ